MLFSGVGKTSLIGRYLGNLEPASPTIGASFFNCKLTLDNTKIKLQVGLKIPIFIITFIYVSNN